MRLKDKVAIITGSPTAWARLFAVEAPKSLSPICWQAMPKRWHVCARIAPRPAVTASPDGQPMKSETGIMQAAAFRGQIHPSAYTKASRVTVQTISAA